MFASRQLGWIGIDFGARAVLPDEGRLVALVADGGVVDLLELGGRNVIPYCLIGRRRVDWVGSTGSQRHADTNQDDPRSHCLIRSPLSYPVLDSKSLG